MSHASSTKTTCSRLFESASCLPGFFFFSGNNKRGLCLTHIKAGPLPLSTSIISPPQAMIIKKKNHSKNCDISNLCIELVVKEMSQRDLWSRGAAALLRECYPAAGGVLCPPLGLCGQTPSCTSTKLSNMGLHSQQLWMSVDLWSKSITIFCSHWSKRQSGSHILTTSTWQIHLNLCPTWSTILLPISNGSLPPQSSLESSHSTPFNCWTSERSSDETDGKCQNLLLMKDAYRCAVLGIQRDRRRGRETEAAVKMVVCSPVRAML